jgi:probable F420-dependent oxidoreductase
LTPQDCQELARRAEDRGYESVWLPEGHSRDAFTSLAAMALGTQRVMLGTGIIQVFGRTAANTAMAASGMAALSGGRFILGLGVGHGPNVEAWDGVPFKQPITRLKETIQIARGLLSGEQVDFSGKQFKVSGISLDTAAPSGKVPIYIAALGPQMLEIAGEMADGILMNWPTAAFLPQAVEHVRRGADKAGRDLSEIDIAGYVRVAVGDDMEALREGLRGQVVRQAGLPYYSNMFKAAGFEKEIEAVSAALAAGNKDEAMRAVTIEMQDQVAVVGSPSHCRQQFEARRAAGLQLPVVAPFTVGDTLASHRSAIDALAP